MFNQRFDADAIVASTNQNITRISHRYVTKTLIGLLTVLGVFSARNQSVWKKKFHKFSGIQKLTHEWGNLREDVKTDPKTWQREGTILEWTKEK